MTPVVTRDDESDPAWNSFSIQRTDFRPHWDGDYVNLFSAVEPQASEEATLVFMQNCVRKLAEWILANRSEFGAYDRFQLIIGWPKSTREFNRQVIKAGGTYEDIELIVSREDPLEPKRFWSKDVF